MAFSLEALLALVASAALLLAISSHSAEPQPSLSRLYDYQVLNDFLEVREKGAQLTDSYVAESGFCLRLEEQGSTTFLPGSCSQTLQKNAVSTERVVAEGNGFTTLRAWLWKR